MSDRELLELAAKASGVFLTKDTLSDFFPGWDWEDEDEPRHEECGGISGTVVIYGYDGELSGTTRETWNPLEDDGEAFRLAVKLQLTVCNEHINSGAAYCTNGATDYPMVVSGENEEEVIGSDFAATRRAIVLAAAEIGRRL